MDTQEITIRKAETCDAEAVLAVYRSVIGSEGCAWREEYPTIEDVMKDAEEKRLYVLCGEQGAIWAAAASGPDDDFTDLSCWNPDIRRPCELSRLGVRIDLQGKGFAKTLVRYIEEEARENGYDGMRLLASVNNPRALALYERLGYSSVGETVRWDMPWRCYEKTL